MIVVVYTGGRGRSEAVVGRGDDEARGLPGAQGRRPPLRLGRVADGQDFLHDDLCREM